VDVGTHLFLLLQGVDTARIPSRVLELFGGGVVFCEIVREKVVAVRLHWAHDRAIQPGVIQLQKKKSCLCQPSHIGVGVSARRTSGPRSPGRSLNRNRSYAFAQMSASGSTSYVATARKRGFVGCRSELSCSALPAAAKEFSIDASWASRDISTASFVLRECGWLGEKMLESCGAKGRQAGKGQGTYKSAAVARGVGAELSRDMYSVLRSHETFAGTGGVPLV